MHQQMHTAVSCFISVQYNKILHIDDLVQERRNFIANAVELRLPCINPSIYHSSDGGNKDQTSFHHRFN